MEVRRLEREFHHNGVKLPDTSAAMTFCKARSRNIVGRRLNIDRFNLVKDFVFPPSHAELLPVRPAYH